MAVTPSTMLKLGTRAPDFSLPDTDDSLVSLADLDAANGLLVMFICNHCPFVKLIADHMAAFASSCQTQGISVVAISANDVTTHPHDGPLKMREEKANRGYTFPYLYDEIQATAKAYHAACTPDFFLFNADRELVYRGRYDDATPGNEKPVTGSDLDAAVQALLAGKPIDNDQKPSMGCNIKWRAGSEPDYFS